MKTQLFFRPLTGAALLIVLAAPLAAQPGGGRGPRGGREFDPRDGRFDGPRRGPRARHELERLWHGLGELEKSNSALSQAQAAKVVALVLPWSKRPTLSETDAATLRGQIEAVLTAEQRAKIQAETPRGRRGGRGFGPQRGPESRDGQARGRRPERGGPREGGPREGGPRGGGPREEGPRGARPARPGDAEFEATRTFRDALNPFYPPTGYASWKSLPSELQQDVAERYREGRTLLESLSRKAKR